MSPIYYKLPRRSLLVLSGLWVSSLLVFQSATQTIAARVKPRVPVAHFFAARVAPTSSITMRRSSSLIVSGTQRPEVSITIWPRHRSLTKTGPEFMTAFIMNSFSVVGFVKGGWPIVIDYELGPDSTAQLTIATEDKKHTHVIKLEPSGDQHKEVIEHLPEEFGKHPKVGVLSFIAVKSGAGQQPPARFFLYGLGLGDHAVGSMVIDQLLFKPGSIHPKLKEKAFYSFHSRSDFNKASADFMLVTLARDGVMRPQLAARRWLKNGIRRDESVSKDWDGKNDNGNISHGSHQFHVRAWRSSKNDRDWVFAAIRQEVKVE